MALPLQSSSYPHNPFRLLPISPLRLPPHKPTYLAKSQNPSEPQNPTINGPKSTTPTQPASSGLGFGPKNNPAGNSSGTRKRRKGQKNRTVERPSPVTRLPPVEKPMFMSEQGVGSEWEGQERIGRIFFLTWLGFGSAILIEGILLSASGFLPEELDNFFKKYLYPTFTPAVILFFGGAIAFGVLIYRKNEKLQGKK